MCRTTRSACSISNSSDAAIALPNDRQLLIMIHHCVLMVDACALAVRTTDAIIPIAVAWAFWEITIEEVEQLRTGFDESRIGLLSFTFKLVKQHCHQDRCRFRGCDTVCSTCSGGLLHLPVTLGRRAVIRGSCSSTVGEYAPLVIDAVLEVLNAMVDRLPT